MISRDEVLRRARELWPQGTVPYSQDSFHQATGYRQDCSGFVSMCWGIPRDAPGSWGGMSTVSLVTNGWMYEIKPSDLLPGDAVGICGPGTGGDDGHVVLFERWISDADDESAYWLIEQAGGRMGPVRRAVEYPYGYGTGAPWRAFRFRDITDTPGGDMAAGDADKAFSVAYDGHGPWVRSDSWMAKAVEAPLVKANAAIATLRAEVQALRAELAARPAATVSAEQVAEISRQVAAGIGDAVGDVLAARMQE